MKKNCIFILALLIIGTLGISAQTNLHPKREFRGVWMHTVSNNYYKNLTPEQWRDTISKQLDEYQKNGINAIVFQVRPEGDAFYKSDLEPWSRFLTGEQGKAPEPFFDPMEFLIEECHKRCMEFHAWLNPYRANSNKENRLVWFHRYYEKRYLFISYGNQLFFNPGIPENREFICQVVKDIVSRYDVDAIHMDDYFYPYPIKGIKFPDDATFKKYGIPDGYTNATKGDWRRDNVNKLIQELNSTIKSTKPWVRFGISPFGIYRNKRQDENGSNTNGLCNYDDLYADIMLWVRNGWIDYCVPQLYWGIGHKLADFEVLAHWWAENTNPNVRLYIGEDVMRTYNQLAQKMELTRSLKNIEGNCFWSGDALLKNPGGIEDSLQKRYHLKPALLPLYNNIDSISPDAPYKLNFDLMGTEPLLKWESGIETLETNKVRYYAVYSFDINETINITSTRNLLGFTINKYYTLPENADALCKKYVVTAIDRVHNESKPSEALLYTE